MPGTQGKKGARNFRVPGLASHPVVVHVCWHFVRDMMMMVSPSGGVISRKESDAKHLQARADPARETRRVLLRSREGSLDCAEQTLRAPHQLGWSFWVGCCASCWAARRRKRARSRVPLRLSVKSFLRWLHEEKEQLTGRSILGRVVPGS